MTSDELRELFLRFFEGNEHKRVPSSSLVPHGDPTLLLTTAGMVQFKPYFLGQAAPPGPRLTSCQKCFRTTDIGSVGDDKHLTFFEMLGNFSVSDYFKQEAITWAWEFVTQRLKMPEERLWATVYLDDDDAAGLWTEVGVPAERIVRLGDEENFWGPAGGSGPCGPCSEIHYDRGRQAGCNKPDCNPGCDCDRFVEIWNLVFVQFNQGVDGTRTPLPNPSIDTGMGLERTAAILQGSTSVYDTDVFIPLLNRVAEMSGYEYGKDEVVNKAMRIVAEHSRGIVFLIVDGVTPSNEGRGYVLRRILRRAAIFGRKLGLNKPFLKGMTEAVIHAMGSAYPELSMRRDFILQVAQMEEEKFQDTLDVGLQCLKEIIRTKQKTANLRGISGEEAFVLYDTYGFPVELTQEMAMGEGFEVDMDGFETKMERQRERARSAHKFGGKRSSGMDYSELALPSTEFIGYETIDGESRIVHLAVAGKAVDMVMAGQMVDVILDRTPFYGEMGGQVGDTGRLTGQDGVAEVEETVWSNGEIIRHHGMVLEGKMTLGDTVRAEVDAERRKDIARNHTATHLLQTALRQVLGSQVQQMGSLVAPDHMRFDFSYLRALTRDEVIEVQRRVNERVRQNMTVRSRDTLYSDAIDEGVIALFDEKYGDVVRVVEVGGASELVSAELCGGTHASATGDIGLLFITSEGSIGAGLRRIEGVTGREAEALVESYILSLQDLAGQLKSRPGEVLQKVTALTTELETERKRSASMERELSRHVTEDLVDRSQVVNGIPVLVANVAASTTVALREMGDALREKLKSGVVVLGTVLDGRPQFLAMVTPDLVSRGLHAGNIIKRVAQVTGGGGGGKPEMAQAGGKDRSRLDEALGLVEMLVGRVGKDEA